MKHASNDIHDNSIAGYHQEKEAGRLSKRATAILETCRQASGALTDREIMKRLGFVDMNSVRPRITEMVDAGVLRETGSTIDPETGKTCRLIRPATKPAAREPLRAQGSLF